MDCLLSFIFQDSQPKQQDTTEKKRIFRLFYILVYKYQYNVEDDHKIILSLLCKKPFTALPTQEEADKMLQEANTVILYQRFLYSTNICKKKKC